VRLDRITLLRASRFLLTLEEEKRNLKRKCARGELLRGRGDRKERQLRYEEQERATFLGDRALSTPLRGRSRRISVS
jgi:hypothetical protein